MDSQLMIMRTGAGRYIQGEHAAAFVGRELRRLGYHTVGVVAGKRAFEAAAPSLLPGLEAEGLAYAVSIYPGFCTADDIAAQAQWAKQQKADCLLGAGGGKIMDLTKAAGVLAGLPVFTLPTIAATCAAFAPLSVIYGADGHQETIRYHEDSVSGVFVDLSILAQAPERYLAAGIADAYAKYCEYTSMLPKADYERLDFGRFMGASLAHECDEVLHRCAAEAYRDNCDHRITRALSDAVSCVIAVVGVISGFGAYSARGNARFAIAHAFNEIIRGRYVPDPRKYLHGEIVAVGIMAQLRANGAPREEIERLEALFQSMGVPTRLSQIDMDYDDEQLRVFAEDLIAHAKIDAAHRERVLRAVFAVR